MGQKRETRELNEVPEPRPSLCHCSAYRVLTVLCSEALSSWFGSQQGDDEQETAAFRGSHFQGMVEYLFSSVLL